MRAAIVLGLLLLAGAARADTTIFTIVGDAQDCTDCPPMVVLGPGHFRMGQDEVNDTTGPPMRLEPKYARSAPVVWVDIVAPFASAKYLVTRGQFRTFVTESGYQPAHDCAGGYSMNWSYSATGTKAGTLAALAARGIVLNPPPGEMDWEHNDLQQDDTHPVTCISRADALAYINWFNLNRKPAGLPKYRLMAPIEYEYATRAGDGANRYTWGDNWHIACFFGNIGDQAKGAELPDTYDPPIDCNDGWVFTSPVGTFPPNNAGLYDINGNLSNMLGGYLMWGNDPPPEHHNLPGYNRCISMGALCDVNHVPAAGGAWYKSEMKIDIAHYSGNLISGAGYPKALPFNGFRLARDCRTTGPC